MLCVFVKWATKREKKSVTVLPTKVLPLMRLVAAGWVTTLRNAQPVQAGPVSIDTGRVGQSRWLWCDVSVVDFADYRPGSVDF